MTRKTRILIAIALTIPELVIPLVLYLKHRRERPSSSGVVTLVGAVLRNSNDPTKEIPLPGVRVSAQTAKASVSGVSDPAGRFQLQIAPGKQQVQLTFQIAGYKTLRLNASSPGNQLYLARMEALEDAADTSSSTAISSKTSLKVIDVKDVRVRYSSKDESAMVVGSFAKQFMAANAGNVSCNGKGPCSPDGRWNATNTIIPLDAEQGNEFRNVRVSCIAGPCTFTKIDAGTFAKAARTLNIAVLNWSDAAVFLVEADITRTMVAERVRESYPFIVGRSMSFSLPSSAEGLSIQANVAGEQIVYPLGPPLLLSWATCSAEVASSGNSKIYRCILKPGFRFQPA